MDLATADYLLEFWYATRVRDAALAREEAARIRDDAARIRDDAARAAEGAGGAAEEPPRILAEAARTGDRTAWPPDEPRG